MALRVLELFEAADGGIPEHVRQLTVGLSERGHEITVAGPPHASQRPGLTAAAREYVPLELVGSLVAPGSDARALTGLISLLRRRRFDLVHAHGQKPAFVARVVAPFFGIPVVYTPNGFVYRFQHLRPRRSSRARAALILGAERLLRRRLGALIAVSDEERRAAIDDGVAPAQRVFLVENGVAPQLDAAPEPALVEFRGEGPLFGLVAGLRDQKGLPTLLDALELLAGQGRPVRFAIVGNGPFEAMVRERAGSPRLASTTLALPFAGRVEPYLAALDAFVLPSYWEGMPIALLEAAAMGLPAVASAVNGTVEVVDEGQTGLLVPSHDSVALAEAIARLAADPELRARMGRAARAQGRGRFAARRMVDETEAVYLQTARIARPDRAAA
jgi:glycosyltransferase involved in cell wall biosynthesis